MGIFDNIFGGQPNRSAEEIIVANHELVCPICQGRRFWHRRTLMNTPGMALLDIDWANKQADNFICDGCGYIFWFMPRD
jgi:hypothetical protein